jgi:hypothetical protein
MVILLVIFTSKSIAGVNPRIATGLMTSGASWTTYSGVAFERWFTALGATKARPARSATHGSSSGAMPPAWATCWNRSPMACGRFCWTPDVRRLLLVWHLGPALAIFDRAFPARAGG